MSTSTTFSTTTNPPRTSEQILSVQDISSSLQRFGWADYFVFVLMLMICAGIGVYFGFVEKRKKNEQKNAKERDIEDRRGSEALDYLVGGRKMKVIPVSLSLVASFVSGISLLGTSTEIYVYGTQYAFILVTIVIAGFISWYIFLPVFVNLQLTSTYEYFELRFGKGLRLFGSAMFVLGSILWLPIAIYVPALTFMQVSGVSLYTITPIVCAICVFYTCVGGIKAVVWTDAVQSGIMFGTYILVMIKGTIDLGGLGVVIDRNMESGRLELPEFTLDPTVRMGALAIFLGGTVNKIIGNGIHQSAVQRYLSLPSMKEVNKAVIYFCLGLIGLYSVCVYTGLLCFATFYDCDPLTTKLAQKKDQIVPLFVMEKLGEYPGVPGLFVSGVFSAALSSLSTNLNSISACVYEDFIKPRSSRPMSRMQVAFIMRLIVVIFGVSSFGLVFLVEKLGTVLQLSLTLHAITNGPLLGIFATGICLPWIKSKSAVTGGLTAFVIMAYISFRGHYAVSTGEVYIAKKPVSIDGCDYEFDRSALGNSSIYHEPTDHAAKELHHISFLLYSTVGAIVAIFSSFISSFYFGFNDTSEVDRKLISPIMHRFMKSQKYDGIRMSTVNQED